MIQKCQDVKLKWRKSTPTRHINNPHKCQQAWLRRGMKKLEKYPEVRSFQSQLLNYSHHQRILNKLLIRLIIRIPVKCRQTNTICLSPKYRQFQFTLMILSSSIIAIYISKSNRSLTILPRLQILSSIGESWKNKTTYFQQKLTVQKGKIKN